MRTMPITRLAVACVGTFASAREAWVSAAVDVAEARFGFGERGERIDVVRIELEASRAAAVFASAKSFWLLYASPSAVSVCGRSGSSAWLVWICNGHVNRQS